MSEVTHEFRMTILLPRYHTLDDISAWADELGSGSCLKFQNFSPKSAMYPDLAGHSVFSPDDFEKLAKTVKN